MEDGHDITPHYMEIPSIDNRKTVAYSDEKETMEVYAMLDLERKIEKTIYKATLALDENNWSAWFELCDESFTLSLIHI